jgi:hypothetical protein
MFMKRLAPAVVVLLSVWMVACGGKKTTTTTSTVAISISPTTATVGTSQGTQFTATVTGDTNTAVTWAVNGVAAGNTSFGTISSTGFYVAPATLPSPASVTVTATSQKDTTKSASATVTITATSSLTVTPSSVVLAAGAQQTFTATLAGQSVAVIWSVHCQSANAADCGSITSAGVYTAPLSPPPGGSLSVTASTGDNSAVASNASVVVQLANGSLSGQYAFTLLGRNSGGPYAAAGSVTFDGNGHVIAGTEDVNRSVTFTLNITGGTYQVGTDGRGTATLQTSSGNLTWQFVLVNHAQVFAVQTDAAGVVSHGTLDLQDATQFNLGAIQGRYTVSVEGTIAGGADTAQGGAFSADGAGIISGGLLDTSSAFNLAATLTGSYTAPSSSGRGTVTLSTAAGSQTFVYYVVDGTRLKLVENDAVAVTSGEVVKQSAGPFSSATFQGVFAFTVSGSSSRGAFGQGGTFALDGAGNISRGITDVNDAGSQQSAATVSGNYAVTNAATGRTTLTLNFSGATRQFVVYPQASGALALLEVDAINVARGLALPQTASVFSNASFVGNYAFRLSGTNLTAPAHQEDITGQLLPNGGSAVRATLDINDNGTLSPATAVQVGSYSLDSSTGRGVATLQTNVSAFSSATLNFYFVDSRTVLFLESDGARVLVGTAQKQF